MRSDQTSLGRSCGNSRPILLSSVLHLLAAQLDKLAHSSFFSPELTGYVSELVANVNWLKQDITSPHPQLEADLVAPIVDAIWHATQFLTGTTSSRVPYEVTYLLREVLLDWGLEDSIVTTSLIQSPDFYCESVSRAPTQVLNNNPITGLALSKHLVQIGMPEIFQHMPLFCAPLYHEIAHYVDDRLKIIKRVLMQREFDIAKSLPARHYFELNRTIMVNHLTEHFCDLFAACYVGDSVIDYIVQWCPPGASPERTHPLPEDRAELTADFLAGRQNDLVDILREAVMEEGLGEHFQPNFELPEVGEAFADARPAKLGSIRELHGLLPAANRFLIDLLENPTAYKTLPIGAVDGHLRISLINDLVEKSIRNFMITKAWNDCLDATAVS